MNGILTELRIFEIPPGSLRNPWVRTAPTFTGASVIAARKIEPPQPPSAEKKVTIKRLHGIEMLKFAGWDLPMFGEDGLFFDETQTPELYGNMSGNMWTIFHFTPDDKLRNADSARNLTFSTISESSC